MPIRMSGLSSGLDTEALVSALVSSYSLKKDNLVKAQTRLSWTQSKWKTMNTSIYSFYTGKLSSARLSTTYSLKSASVSNSSYAKVTASSAAVNGTQTLKVTGLAATGYLTGGTISGTTTASDGTEKTTALTGDSKLSTVTGLNGLTSGSISVSVDGTDTTIDLTSDMTINQFTAKLKEAGLNASFDATNQRFFVSSKTSGKDHDFALIANNADGQTALESLGLYSYQSGSEDASAAEYRKWAAYTDSEITALKDAAYESAKISYETRAKAYADRYNAALAARDKLTEGGFTVSAGQTQITLWSDLMEEQYGAYKKVDAETGDVTYDTDKMKADGVSMENYNKYTTDIANMQKNINAYNQYTQEMEDTRGYVNLDDGGKAVAATATDSNLTAYNKVAGEVDTDNAAIRTNTDAKIDEKVNFAKEMVAKMDAASSDTSTDGKTGAIRIQGADSSIELNGATFTGNTNNFSINGLTIQVSALTGDEKVTITTDTDTDGIYNTIKDLLKEYNSLIKSMDEAYNAASAGGYEPLTSAEKEAMTDDEVTQWETKIKDSLLRKDSTLGSTATSLKNDMQQTFTFNGKTYSLSSFGISTLGYFSSGDNEKGVLHIDGDKDDTSTAGNTDKLRAMIASDPEAVVSFFSQLATNMYADLGKRMAGTTSSSAFTIYNDKEMATEYSEYNTKISDQAEKITTWEDYYYKKFTAMESALASLNSQSSSLSSLLG